MDKQRFIKISILIVMVIQMFMILLLLWEIRERQISTTGNIAFIKNYCLDK